jgi:hypothetical protein
MTLSGTYFNTNLASIVNTTLQTKVIRVFFQIVLKEIFCTYSQSIKQICAVIVVLFAILGPSLPILLEVTLDSSLTKVINLGQFRKKVKGVH